MQAFLRRIDALQPRVNAFITVAKDSVLAAAATLDQEAATGHFRGPLHGVPLAIKDNIDTAGVRTTVGSLVFDDRVPDRDAFVIQRLRAAGALVLGKANLHEFAMGGSSVTSGWGAVHNPWALDKEAGGSSGGSAAALASAQAPAALGTDTGGSIRIPAAWCGVVGLKPTYGLVSLGGIFPLIYPLDHCGPMTRSVEDAALMLTAMAGYDKQDPSSVEHPPENYLQQLQQPIAHLRLGVPRQPFFERLDPEIARIVETALDVLRGTVNSVREVRLPATDALDWKRIRSAEVAAVHRDLFQRQGDMYSLQTHDFVQGTLHDLDSDVHSGAERAADLVTAYRNLTELRRNIDDAFDGFDLVVLPTNRIGPRTIAEEREREEKATPHEPEVDFNSLAFDLYGIPAVSVPCGFTRAGLPVGLTIAGPRFSEGRVLAVAAAYERRTSWRTMSPLV